MDEKTYQTLKQEYERGLDRLMDYEAQLLDCVREMFDMLNERIPLAMQLKEDGERLTRAARELGKDEMFKLRILANLPTPAEVVHDFMVRYTDRYTQQGKGAKLDYESLLSNRIRPTREPGKQYTSTGHEVDVTGPRKLRPGAAQPGQPEGKTGRAAGLTTYNRNEAAP